MRRALFGKSPETEIPSTARASVREALLFDVRDHEASNDFALAERRVDDWTFAPWLLLAGHLVITATLVFQDRPSSHWGTLASAMAPLGLSLLVDLAAGLVMLGVAAHADGAAHRHSPDVRLYRGDGRAVDALERRGRVGSTFAMRRFATVAMMSGFFMRSIAAVASPPLAVVNAAMAIVSTTSVFAPIRW